MTDKATKTTKTTGKRTRKPVSTQSLRKALAAYLETNNVLSGNDTIGELQAEIDKTVLTELDG